MYLDSEHPQPYLSTLYKAIFATAYYGLFRISEVVKGEHVIKAKDVHIADNKEKIMFVLFTSKTHWWDNPPQSVKISSQGTSSRAKRHCPYSLLREYMAVRVEYERDDEPFFVYRDGSPVQPATINKILKEALILGNVDPKHRSFHCLRSGRVVDLLNLGVSVETIKKQ